MRHLFGLSVKALSASLGSGSSLRIVCQSFDRARSTVWLPVGPYPFNPGPEGPLRAHPAVRPAPGRRVEKAGQAALAKARSHGPARKGPDK